MKNTKLIVNKFNNFEEEIEFSKAISEKKMLFRVDTINQFNFHDYSPTNADNRNTRKDPLSNEKYDY